MMRPVMWPSLKLLVRSGGRDTVEEYMVCGLSPLLASFNLGEIVNGETPVLKLTFTMLEFLVTRCTEETNDGFWARVELATANIVGQYAHREHKVCVKIVPNGGRVNMVFE
jgi:hypothetical protein